MLTGRKILIGVTGSIAAYKTILLTRLLVKAGAVVKIVMTEAAADFVSPLVLETLSKNPVVSGLANGNTWSNHVMLGRWADLMLIAPASCNTISKMAAGGCDNLLLAVYLSATCPVWVAPAMDEDMWKHPGTQQNIAKLTSFGNKVLGVTEGDLASGLTGAGRMLEPDELFRQLQSYFEHGPLEGKRAIVTAGPTFEPIDPVRYIGNHSSGKMGIALAAALAVAGAETTLVVGPVTETIPPGIEIVRVTTAQEMYDAAVGRFPACHIAVMAAAVADYRAKDIAGQKIKKDAGHLMLELVKNPDILKECGSLKTPGQLLVGFALETEHEADHARAKLTNKNADMIVLNSMNDKEAGFGKATNKVTIFERNGTVHPLPVMSKQEVAAAIVSIIIEKIHED